MNGFGMKNVLKKKRAVLNHTYYISKTFPIYTKRYTPIISYF